jgi:peptide chain release factor subunit 1
MNVPDLRKLADTYDTRPSFISLYMNVTKGVDAGFIRRRERECLSALSGDREGTALFKLAMAQVERRLAEGQAAGWGAEGIAIFSSPKNAYTELFGTPGDIDNLLVFDSSPYIKPLVQAHHEYDEYIIVILDHSHARIFVVSMREIIQKDCVAEEIVRKHRHGGMSQLRFQRLHDGWVDHYLKEVAEHLHDEVVKCQCIGRLSGIVLAGPADAKTEFESYISPELRKFLVGHVALEADAPDGTVIRSAEGLVRQKERARESDIIEKLKSGILRHGLATYGYEEVHIAIVEGRADTLVIQKGYSRGGWRCEKCRGFGAGAPQKCPVCGERPIPVDAIEEVVELAMDKGTKVEFVPADSGIAELGGIGALLRY